MRCGRCRTPFLGNLVIRSKLKRRSHGAHVPLNMSAEKKQHFSQLIIHQHLEESGMIPLTKKLPNMSAHVPS